MSDAQFLYADVRQRKRNHLPHWDVVSGIYFVTFCLADAISAAFRRQLADERSRRLEEIQKRFGKVSIVDVRSVDRELTRRLFDEMDRGAGACYLSRQAVAEVVEDSIVHFNGSRYMIVAYALMPNHVHVVFRPEPAYQWWQVVGSWKSFTAKQANKILGRTGTFWQDDNFDRLVRTERSLRATIDYVIDNPRKANLRSWPWVKQLLSESFENL